jgi:DNA-binding transcriptional ArsR family regulator
VKKNVQNDKKIAFEILSSIAHALGSPARMRIIQLLSNSSFSVEDISLKINESIANTSQHLQKLKKVEIVKDTRVGVTKIYSLTNSNFIDVYLELQKVASKLSPKLKAVEDKLCPPELISELPLNQILQQVKNKKAVMIDVRDPLEFKKSAAPMAIYIPRNDIKGNLKLLPRTKPVYVYCRGLYCSLANVVVRDLKKRGYKAFRLKEMAYEIQKKLK